MQSPLWERRIFSTGTQDVVRPLDQKMSQVSASGLGDAELRVTFAGLAPSWPKPEIATNIATSPKPLLVAQSENEGRAVILVESTGLGEVP